MTEAEWLACADPEAMLNHLGKSASQRKLRLFACACFRAGEPWDDRGMADSIHDTLPLAEQLADGIAQDEDVQRAVQTERHPRNVPSPMACLLGSDAFSGASVGSQVAALSVGMKSEGKSATDTFDAIKIELVKQAPLLRDIFGNPFRPGTFNPEWRTDTAVVLARQMYESREFGAMPILADALQDAGCENTDILSHCRDTNATHVRGCWVVDLVLGKE